MSNKIALVTGGTDGVGLSVVKAMLEQDFQVFFIGSNQAKGDAVVAELEKATGHKSGEEINFIQLDLSDLKAVKTFADSFLTKVNRLDVLLFSAGVMMPKRQETEAGIEKTFAIGYLSAYILSHALLPLLEKGDDARLLTVSGGGPIVLKPRLDFDDLNNAKAYSGFKAAMRTVHAKVVLTQTLAEKYSDKNISFNTFHPGMVSSGLGRNMPWPLNKGMSVAALLMPKDSPTAIHASLSGSLKGVSNKFLYKKKQIPLSFDKSYRDKLVELTEEVLGGF